MYYTDAAGVQVEALAGLHCPDPKDEGFLRTFEKQVWDLVTVEEEELTAPVGEPAA